ncbi:MAG: FAD-dependent oxidoreductase [Gemmatimonadales bacterium]|nr:FAD-dependent oxidoreductase [Gemmatimonadales bacterium]
MSSASRRDALRRLAAAALVPAMPHLTPASRRVTAPSPRGPVLRRGAAPHVVVVGAGAFGGWTALSLLRRGARVTLLDAWGAGHSRASSGDESRVIRAMYNGDVTYTTMVQRSLDAWREANARWQRTIFHRIGTLYLFSVDDAFARASLPIMRERGLDVETLAADELRRRFPQVRPDGIRTAYFEPDSGYLLAREGCERVREECVALGADWRIAAAAPGKAARGRLERLPLADGTALDADAFVFACGPWLGRLFPDAVGDGITPTRQETLYFGLPAGDTLHDDGRCPVWLDIGARRLYGIPGNERRGFKVADDTTGPTVADPTTLDRLVSPGTLRIARALLRRRFPALAKAPVAETRVCQYEFAPGGDFLLDRHPGLENVWLAGGGSGHGYKMGPAVGELVAGLVLDGAATPEKFSHARFVAGREQARKAGGRREHN